MFRKFLVSDICCIEIVRYIKKFTIVNIFGRSLIKKCKLLLIHEKFQLNVQQKTRGECFEVEYFVKLSQYFFNLDKQL